MKFRSILPVLTLAFVFILGAPASSFGQSKNYSYISPAPGSEFIRPENNIVFRHGDILDESSIRENMISVSGSISGDITGKITLSEDSRTLIFIPEKKFAYGELIRVNMMEGVKTLTGERMEDISFGFRVMEKDNSNLLKKFYEKESRAEPEEYSGKNSIEMTAPAGLKDFPENFPFPTVTEFDDPTPEYTFYSAEYAGNDEYYLMVFDNYGIPVFYRQWPMVARDLRMVSPDRLMYCQRNKSNPSQSEYYLTDKNFTLLDTLRMGNGYDVDTHDALYLDNGNYILIAYDPQPYAMDTVVPGGDPNATVIGFIIQELDPDDNVIFQWRSWDHFQITDAVGVDLTEPTIDYVHGNAIDVDYDNHLIFSCRHMDEITKIDRNSGDIIWRFGLNAVNNMFTFTNDTIGFSHQHDIRRLENGHYMLYDNGNLHDPKFSQSVEYDLNETDFTATLVWNYINEPVVYGRAQGSSHRLFNENTLVCWGRNWPVCLTEASYNKNKVWEVEFPEGIKQYRAYKYGWSTDLFSTNVDAVDFGEYDDYVPWPFIIVLYNNGSEDIEITNAHKHTDSYNIVTGLPLTIPAGGSANFTINFFPTQEGQIDDVLTLMAESMFMDTLQQMIARQVFLTGFVQDDVPPEVSFDPADGSEEVPQDAIITIEFNEPVTHADGNTLKTLDIPDLIKFRETDASGEEVAYSAYIDAWKKVITVTPDTLKPSMVYYLELPAGMVADKAGNALNTAQTCSFTTAEGAGIPESNTFPLARIFPNPNNGLITVEFLDMGPKEIKLYDTEGRLIYLMNQSKEQRLKIDISDRPHGIYFIRVKDLETDETMEMKTLKQ